MIESNLWNALRPRLAPFGDLRRIENSVEKGTPDVLYCLRRNPLSCGISGLVELKTLDSLPERGGPVRVPKLTDEQVTWAEDWHVAGGRAGLLLRAGNAYVALPPPQMRPLYDGLLTVQALRLGAAVFAVGPMPVAALLKWLTRDVP
jgi:hypothetical protein